MKNFAELLGTVIGILNILFTGTADMGRWFFQCQCKTRLLASLHRIAPNIGAKIQRSIRLELPDGKLITTPFDNKQLQVLYLLIMTVLWVSKGGKQRRFGMEGTGWIKERQPWTITNFSPSTPSAAVFTAVLIILLDGQWIVELPLGGRC